MDFDQYKLESNFLANRLRSYDNFLFIYKIRIQNFYISGNPSIVVKSIIRLYFTLVKKAHEHPILSKHREKEKVIIWIANQKSPKTYRVR